MTAYRPTHNTANELHGLVCRPVSLLLNCFCFCRQCTFDLKHSLQLLLSCRHIIMYTCQYSGRHRPSKLLLLKKKVVFKELETQSVFTPTGHVWFTLSQSFVWEEFFIKGFECIFFVCVCVCVCVCIWVCTDHGYSSAWLVVVWLESTVFMFLQSMIHQSSAIEFNYHGLGLLHPAEGLWWCYC